MFLALKIGVDLLQSLAFSLDPIKDPGGYQHMHEKAALASDSKSVQSASMCPRMHSKVGHIHLPYNILQSYGHNADKN